MADAIEQAVAAAAPVVHQWTDDQLKTLIAALQPKVPARGTVALAEAEFQKVLAQAEAIGKAGVADVKAIPWGHVVTYLMSVATPIAIHLLGLFGL